MLGQPLKVQDMGETHVSLDVFEEFLRGKQPRFRYSVLVCVNTHLVHQATHQNICTMLQMYKFLKCLCCLA